MYNLIVKNNYQLIFLVKRNITKKFNIKRFYENYKLNYSKNNYYIVESINNITTSKKIGTILGTGHILSEFKIISNLELFELMVNEK